MKRKVEAWFSLAAYDCKPKYRDITWRHIKIKNAPKYKLVRKAATTDNDYREKNERRLRTQATV